MNNQERDDKLELDGVVVESNKGIFKVQVNETHFVNCKLSGKIRLNDIKVIVGDQVLVEVSPYCLTLGRITRRIKSS